MTNFCREMPLPTGLEKPSGGKLLIYPWEKSATGYFGESKLWLLREMQSKDLAEMLLPSGAPEQAAAFMELIHHGKARKAAETARTLTTGRPQIKKTLKSRFDADVAKMLFDQSLGSIPDSPEEFRRGTVEYVQ